VKTFRGFVMIYRVSSPRSERGREGGGPGHEIGPEGSLLAEYGIKRRLGRSTDLYILL
jgi:hypothetical protein